VPAPPVAHLGFVGGEQGRIVSCRLREAEHGPRLGPRPRAVVGDALVWRESLPASAAARYSGGALPGTPSMFVSPGPTLRASSADSFNPRAMLLPLGSAAATGLCQSPTHGSLRLTGRRVGRQR
jgi:hypothetical protein